VNDRLNLMVLIGGLQLLENTPLRKNCDQPGASVLSLDTPEGSVRGNQIEPHALGGEFFESRSSTPFSCPPAASRVGITSGGLHPTGWLKTSSAI